MLPSVEHPGCWRMAAAGAACGAPIRARASRHKGARCHLGVPSKACPWGPSSPDVVAQYIYIDATASLHTAHSSLDRSGVDTGHCLLKLRLHSDGICGTYLTLYKTEPNRLLLLFQVRKFPFTKANSIDCFILGRERRRRWWTPQTHMKHDESI